MKDITLDFVAKQRQAFLDDSKATAAANSVAKNGAIASSLNLELIRSLPYIFEIDAWDEGITNQNRTARCWAFASLNAVRHNIKRNLGIAENNFELSQNHTYFFDQLEKSSKFIDKMIKMIDKPLNDPDVVKELRTPIKDHGMWYGFCDLADKYGVVPKYMMPDTDCSIDTRLCTRLLEQKLRLSAKQLRDAHAGGAGEDALYDLKEKQMEGIFSILTRFLGAPPLSIRFEYRKADGTFVKLPEMTPQEFYKQYGGMDANDYCFIVNQPKPGYPLGKVYAEDPEKARPVDKRLNLDMDTIKKLVIESLKGGDQVVMGCDVAQDSDKDSGCMSLDLFDYENVFGTELSFPDRETWIAYRGHNGSTTGLHIMTFAGVHFDGDGNPIRWKIQNSYGTEYGHKGFYVMDDSWFCRHVSSVTIARKYMSQDLLDIFDGKAEKLDPKEFF